MVFTQESLINMFFMIVTLITLFCVTQQCVYYGITCKVNNTLPETTSTQGRLGPVRFEVTLGARSHGKLASFGNWLCCQQFVNGRN